MIKFINSNEYNEQLFYKALMLYSYIEPIINKIELFVKFTENIEYNEKSYGLFYCKNGKYYIEIKQQTDKLDMLKTIIHELHHLRQSHNGMIFDNSKPYHERLYEIEADEVSSRILFRHMLTSKL